MVESLELAGEVVTIELLDAHHAQEVVALMMANRGFLEPFEPRRPDSDFTLGGQRQRIQEAIGLRKSDRAYAFAVFARDTGLMVGRVALSNVARGAWQNATLGYWIAEEHNGKGYATEAVRLALRFAFEQIHLHRVQAGVMPENVASARVLAKAGFRVEGWAPRYLKINDAWRDHDQFAITVEEWVG